ncbi:MAG: response regulator, partial [Proteobacteria bacterium]
LQFVCDFDPAIQIVVGDPLRITQVLMNVIGNAIKFTDSGSIEISVRIEGENIAFQIRDSGIGMNPEFVAHVFDSFTQADVTMARLYGGSGLGLSITQNLVALMNGTIQVESLPGSGSNFVIRLPLLATQGASKATGTWKPIDRVPSVVPRRSGRVLVAEDNPVNLLLVEEYLKGLGFEVDSAISGVEAVEKFAIHKYDAVLMDCQMPEMDGFEATRLIRARELAEQSARTPIIAVTANVSEKDREECMRGGMDDYITKPITRSELVGMLDLWLPESIESAVLGARAASDVPQAPVKDMSTRTLLDSVPSPRRQDH